MKIGKNLKELRKAHGYSQELIAEKIAVSRQTISKWENDLSSPSTENLIKLADFFDVDMTVITSSNELSEGKETTLMIDRNKHYVLGAIICFLAFLIGIGYSSLSPLFIGLGILAPMGMSFCLLKLV